MAPISPPMQPKTKSTHFMGVQALRFVAAALVLVAHSTFVIAEKMPHFNYEAWRKGGIGVFIFFVISGFVMVLSVKNLQSRNDGWKLFAKRRVIRIVPMYWLATTLKLIAVLAIPAQTLHSGFDFTHTVGSYLFLPAHNPLGEVKPLHAVGWTLNYEMFFYLIFTIALFIHCSPVIFSTVLFVALAFIGLIFDNGKLGAIGIYTEPFILNFIFGMLIAHFYLSGFRVKYWIATFFFILGALSIAFSDHWGSYFGFPRQGLSLGPAMIVFGVAFLEPFFQERNFKFQLAQQLGDSSYSLYLFHPFLLAAIAVTLRKLNWHNYISALFIMTGLSIIAGWLIYRYIELPVTRIINEKNMKKIDLSLFPTKAKL